MILMDLYGITDVIICFINGFLTAMISKLGNDAFGNFLVDKLSQAGVETDKILRTNKTNTALAFVSLKKWVSQKRPIHNQISPNPNSSKILLS
jgi:hypothetical protein